MNLDRLEEFFSGVDWAPFEAIVNRLYTLKGQGRRPKPPIAYFRAVLVKMLLELTSFAKLVGRLGNNPDLASLCGFTDPPSKMGFSRFIGKLSKAGLGDEIFEEALRQLKDATTRGKRSKVGRPKKGR
jgi:hypothetical protein